MPESRKKVVTVTLQLVITNDLELRELGFRAVRDQAGPLADMPEQSQEAANTAIHMLLLPQIQRLHVPGTQITGAGFQVDDDLREPFGQPPLPPDPSTA